MAIRGILNKLQISSGVFHHDFDSRESSLEALTERIQQSVEVARLLPIIDHPKPNAIQKLQGYFDILDGSRIAQKFLGG